MSNIECTKAESKIIKDVLLRDVLPLINANDIRLLNADEDGEEIMCIVQGYHVGSLSDELLRNHVVAIWYEESILNTINILIGGKNIDI